jgi:hypothetical protein
MIDQHLLTQFPRAEKDGKKVSTAIILRYIGKD